MKRLSAGDRFNFHPAAPLHPAWRALDAALARWVLAHGGSRTLAEVAAWASYADGQGDSALPLAGRHGMPALGDSAQATLAGEALVADAGSAAPAAGVPFVLDSGHFYLRRNWQLERSVARLLRVRNATSGADSIRVADPELDALFGPAGTADEDQRRAVRAALGKRLFVLTGGPGTGKTRTVLRMLLALAHGHTRRTGAAPRFGIAAPTGKAAQRLAAALAAGASEVRTRSSELHAGLDTLADVPATTVHRLLGSRGRAGGFRHGPDNPLDADIVVVDEASMLDLALLRSLLAALRADAVLVLVGDADQLTSVGTGSVLLDLVAVLEEHAASAGLARLRHCFRADQALVPILEAVRQGDAEAFVRHWQGAAESGRVRQLPVRTRAQLSARLHEWAGQLARLFAAAGVFAPIASDDSDAIKRALAVLDARQLLCAQREGEFGAERLSQRLDESIRRLGGAGDAAVWYPGRVVMVVRNDPASGLFNGDVGLCLAIDEAGERDLSVWFPPAAGSQGPRRFAIASLPPSVGAFALTVHKSQGSEYAHVALLLPSATDSPLLNRQLLYTGLSRAARSLELWAEEPALRQALATPIARSGRLRQRLLAAD